MATQKPFVSPSFTYETLEETLDIKPKGAELFIGIPKESSFNENRIALTPEAVGVLVANGHRVIIETKAGDGASYTDNNYSEAGAKITYHKKEVFECDIIVKSAPVSEEECDLLKPNQTIISPIHLAVMKREILQKMMEKKVGETRFRQEFLCDFLSSDALLIKSMTLQSLIERAPIETNKGFAFFKFLLPTVFICD
jgi:alanine dehydrogenase